MSGDRPGDRGKPDVSTSYVTLEIGDEEYTMEHEIADHRALDDCIVVLWDTHVGAHESEPVIPERDRNVVGVNYDGSRAWRVEEPPHDFPKAPYVRNREDDDPDYDTGSYFRYLLEVDGDLHARHTNLHRYELDPATGELGTGVPDNQLTVAGEVRRFALPVQTVVRRRGMTAVLLYPWTERKHLDHEPDPELDTEDHVYCFDSDGAVEWQKDTAFLAMSYQDEGRGEGLWLYPDHRMGNPTNVDIETGY